MNVVDSCGWLEVLVEGSNSENFKSALQDKGALIVPAIVLYEVTKQARRMHGEAYAKAIEALMADRILIEVTREIVAAAIKVSLEHKLATADSLIYATALEYDATLWTQDKHFQGLPRVKFFEKTT